MARITLPSLALLVCAGFGQERARTSLILAHVNIIDAAGGPTKSDMTILISGNRIESIIRADELNVPRNARIIDATGKFVIPGLADMHNHLGNGYAVPLRESAEQPRDFQRNLAEMLHWGFTTVFSPGHASVDLKSFTTLRKAATEDSNPLPRFFGVGRSISVKGGHASRPSFAAFLPETPDEARRIVAEQKAAGVDGIKIIWVWLL